MKSIVKVRIEGTTQAHVFNAGRTLNCTINRIYPMRKGHGFFAYGVSNNPVSEVEDPYDPSFEFKKIPGT
jgi:hypothetical protein